jgi:hypothetical protein
MILSTPRDKMGEKGEGSFTIMSNQFTKRACTEGENTTGGKLLAHYTKLY